MSKSLPVRTRSDESLLPSLLKISEVTRSAPSLDELFPRIHGIVGELMPAANLYIALCEPDGMIRFPYFVDERDPNPPVIRRGHGLTAYVLRTGKAILATPEVFRQLVEEDEIEDVGAASIDWLGAPLQIEGETIGVIGLQSYDEEVRYTERDRDILVFVSRHLAIAIEQKRSEEALRRSELRYRQMFQNNKAVQLVLDPRDGAIVDANESALDFYGYDLESMRKMTIHEINTLTRDEIRQELERASQRQRSFFSFRHRLASGEIRDVEVFSGPFETGGRTLLYSIISDVTEKRRAEELLEMQSAAIESSMDGIAIIDVLGRVEYANPALARMYGQTPQQIQGRRWMDLYSGDEGRRFAREIVPRLEESSQWSGEVPAVNVGGVVLTQEVSITKLDTGSMVVIVRDITERAQAEEQIRHLAYHDPLTELPNRLLFRDRLNVALSQAQRSPSHLAVLFLDLDRFKVINDSLGHNIGDALLQAVARRLVASVRETDTVARLSGDEFTILLTEIGSSSHAIRIARKILEAIRHPFSVANREISVTTSIGVAVYPDDGAHADLLLKNADTAMYQAKENGRNNIQAFNASVSARTLERLAMETGLRRAVSQGELTLHYQTIHEASSGKVRGFEALLRWDHPDLGLIPPMTFLTVAEDLGLMFPIGQWVIRKAALQLVEWSEGPLSELCISVNVSMSQLQRSDFAESIEELIAETGIDPSRLEIEITESTAMQDPAASIATLTAVRNLGVKISVDDFGTGYSSLAYLQKLPIDRLKIDQSFIQDMVTNADANEIVQAIIAMGHRLGLGIVAEGVETEQQREALVLAGCDLLQGYLMSKPAPARSIPAMMTSLAESGLNPF
ncbi:MAG: EAL domain-containing protein [Acidobacteria bacterium]|nr:EAL domain-containing protein [Acidobacteriota bacterium]